VLSTLEWGDTDATATAATTAWATTPPVMPVSFVETIGKTILSGRDGDTQNIGNETTPGTFASHSRKESEGNVSSVLGLRPLTLWNHCCYIAEC
jgi:hypothetical protein